MLKNRSFLVKLVRDDNSVTVNQEPVDYNKIAKIISSNAIKCMVAYVGADTVRRVVVYAVSAKIRGYP